MSVPWTALWRQGSRYLTVTAPDGREWMYDVTPGGDRPLHTFLNPTPWAVYPDAQWEKADQDAGPGVWTVWVFPESPAAALELDADWPPPQSDGNVTGR